MCYQDWGAVYLIRLWITIIFLVVHRVRYNPWYKAFSSSKPYPISFSAHSVVPSSSLGAFMLELYSKSYLLMITLCYIYELNVIYILLYELYIHI
jgi:hypothetical protein